MSKKNLTPKEETALWLLARNRLLMKNSSPAVSQELADRIRDNLPNRLEGETLGEWIRRGASQASATGDIRPFRAKPVQAYEPLCDFVRLAADSSDTGLNLPEPDMPLQSSDGQFQLFIQSVEGFIELTVQALGDASDRFANCTIGFPDPDQKSQLLAELTLDQDGDGSCRVEDTTQLRRALATPQIVLVKPR